jgi:DNA-binding protein
MAAAASAEREKPATTVERDPKFPKNHVRVSLKRSKFPYVDITKYLLNEGESHVDISGLGSAISEVVDIVEVLKSQNLIKVTSIETGRTEESRNTARIQIRVEKSATFDRVFAEQQAAKAAAKAKETPAAPAATA